MMLPDNPRTDEEREISAAMGRTFVMLRCDECDHVCWKESRRVHEDGSACSACGDGSNARLEHPNGAEPRIKLMQTGEGLSEAFGVHPTQIPEAIKAYADKGVKVDFAPDGRMRITSHKHERRVKQALGGSGD